MTDKVQKIREEVERLKSQLLRGACSSQITMETRCKEEAYNEVLSVIDYMQEKPKFKAGDHIRPIDSCLGSPRTIVDVCDSWYVTDQGTLDFEYEDNWELAEEHKKCMYPKDNYTDEDRKVLCDGCEEDCKYAKLNTMLDDALSKENKESWNERLNKKEPSIPDIVDEHCTETEFREIEILRTKLSDIAKAIYYHKGKENPTVERIREIVQDCCFELMDLKKPKQEEPVNEEWIEELRTKLNSMSKEDLKKVFDKYAIDFDEEPVSRTPADIEAAMQEVEEKSRAFTEAHHGEDADTILAQMRGEEPVNIWHDTSEEPDDMSHCLIFYGCKESVGHYLHYEPVFYNKKEKVFITPSFPHPTGYKVEQKSFDGGCVAEIYKDRRDRISISDITQWCYLYDLHNLSNIEKTEKCGKEEPISKDLEEASKEWLRPQLDKSYANYGETKMMELTHFDGYAMLDAIEFGAMWQCEQFEKNRLKHCDSITNEQAELEQGFIDQHLDKHQRMPTFLDAIEYGMRVQKEQMMKDAMDAECDVILLEEGDELQYSVLYPKGKKPFNKGDKVKLIIVKED